MALSASGGHHRKSLAKTLGIHEETVHYLYTLVRNLMAAGAIRLERAGKETHCYLAGFEDS